MDKNNQNLKRRAEDQTAPSKQTEQKKPRTTPRAEKATARTGNRRMSTDDLESPGRDSPTHEDPTRTMLEELKKHFDKTSSNTAAHFEKLIGSVDARVSENSNAIADLKDAVRRIESKQSTTPPMRTNLSPAEKSTPRVPPGQV